MGEYVKGYVLGSSVYKRGIILGFFFLILAVCLQLFTKASDTVIFTTGAFGLGVALFVLEVRINCISFKKKSR